MENNEKQPKISFFLKNDITCPVCGATFKREEMFTGRGRLIAGVLTDELRRLYEPNEKYGTIIPLVYPVTVCPKCFFSAYPEDLGKMKPENAARAKEGINKRVLTINKLFGPVDFTKERTLNHGAASYLLAVDCYDYFDKWVSPTIKKAICAIRAAWLFGDLEVANPDKEFGNIQNLFYKKSLEYYHMTIDKTQKALESFDGIKSFGPDTDSNFGYDGILYLIGVLTLKLGYLEKDLRKRADDFEKAKRYISKMFGSGKASKEKPGPLLDLTRDLYDELSLKVDEINKKLEEEEAAAAAPQPQPPAEE